MYLKRLRLKNYRQFPYVDISFNEGINILIGKNSSGKSSILEAIDFLLSPNNANVSAEDIVPYNMRNQVNIHSSIEGYFQMTKKEKELMCSIFENQYDEQINNSNMEIIFTKHIMKKEKDIDVVLEVQIKGNSISSYNNLMSFVNGSIIPALQLKNVVKITDLEDDRAEYKSTPLYELLLKAPHNSPAFYQYLRNKFYDIKQQHLEDFTKIKNEIKKVYPEMPDMDIDIEYDMKRAGVQVYFTMPDNGIKCPLEDEGAGIKEFFYLFLTLYSFPDKVILKDEAFTHLHKSLLRDFLLSIEGLQFQFITTSHIKELINTLDFGNIIICRKDNGVSTAKNMMQIEEIDTVLYDLGYPIEADPEIKAIIQEIS